MSQDLRKTRKLLIKLLIQVANMSKFGLKKINME